ncbi:PIN domain-containing protein [Streptomyces cavourensis]|uniref:PIN domain-containing protein n=1 Tax=Streptomyces cavourensis TaxID=67258 RepID=UPI0022793369|nr:PIN domain-containing protein [Streptomyces cavourensis]WAE68459.1 PIN domain-containing protein [Streptomyces cavourensis]
MAPSESESTNTERLALIILDANIIKGTSLRGPIADILRAIRAAGVERVATPWIAVEEIAAQQALSYAQKHKAAMDAVDELRKASPWEHVSHPKRWSAEHVRRHWRERYSSVTEVLETSHAAYQQALFRETNQIAPCKTVNSGSHKTGARDAAIWLTAVEYAEAHEHETVYFVSGDSDMSENGQFLPEMQQDIVGMEHRFHLFTSLDDVVTKFAKEAAASPEDVKELLETEDAYATVLSMSRSATRRYRVFSGTPMPSTDGGERRRAYSGLSWSPVAVALDKVLEVSGREVGGHFWFTAWARWLLREERVLRGEVFERAYAWETRVLLSTAADQDMTILDFRRPGPISEEDVPNVPALPYTREERLTRAGEARVSALLRTPSMQVPLARLMEQVGPDLRQIEEVINNILDSSAASRELNDRIAEAVSDLPEEPNRKE